jgi:D-serine deaminase-like pyridoxal phosphate-dependent protein
MKSNYAYYKEIFKGVEMPFAFVDLEMLDRNIQEALNRAGGKKIRIASRALRCPWLLRYIMEQDENFCGILCFSAQEAVYLAEEGFDNLLIGYPTMQDSDIESVLDMVDEGKRIIFTVDETRHLKKLEAICKEMDIMAEVSIDIDMSVALPFLSRGFLRSAIPYADGVRSVLKEIEYLPHIRVAGIMGYESQISETTDIRPRKWFRNFMVKKMKQRAARIISRRRKSAMGIVEEMGFELDFFNGGGTGSIHHAIKEEVLTEITIGSAFFGPSMLDHFRNLHYEPAAGYAIQIVRQPAPDLFTCHGGGYVASGKTGFEKAPVVYLPEGARLIPPAGAGEVHTPVRYQGREKLELGDPVFLRHSKSGELCEHFNWLILVREGRIEADVPTYRGEGRCFL